jgi:hypothetical protein
MWCACNSGKESIQKKCRLIVKRHPKTSIHPFMVRYNEDPEFRPLKGPSQPNVNSGTPNPRTSIFIHSWFVTKQGQPHNFVAFAYMYP